MSEAAGPCRGASGDELLFSWGPMKMSLVDYLKDIGLTYLIMPIVTYGMSRVVPQQR